MIFKSAAYLEQLGKKIWRAQGVNEDASTFLTHTLVEANLAGHDSHGVHYYPRYSERISQGYIKVNVTPEVVKESPTTAFIDGNWGIGQVTARKVTELVIEKAKVNMVAAVGAFNCNHIGRIGYYTEMAAKQGLVGIMFVNVGNPSVSVYRGMGKQFGTNPFSVSTPTEDNIPFLLDYATSVVAAGKVSVAKAKHEKIPTHWTKDKDGNETDDPSDLNEGGWLVPFGEHKGYCLQLASEILGAVLTGSRTGQDENNVPPSPNGVFMIAVNPEAFIGLETFTEKTSELLHKVKEVPPIAGERVQVPGEPEKESKEKRLKEGIPVPDDTWSQIVELCNRLGIDPDFD